MRDGSYRELGDGRRLCRGVPQQGRVSCVGMSDCGWRGCRSDRYPRARLAACVESQRRSRKFAFYGSKRDPREQGLYVCALVNARRGQGRCADHSGTAEKRYRYCTARADPHVVYRCDRHGQNGRLRQSDDRDPVADKDKAVNADHRSEGGIVYPPRGDVGKSWV